MAWATARSKTFVAAGSCTPADLNAIQDQYVRANGIGLSDLDPLVPLPPIGTILPYVGDTAPDANWLLCDGTAVNRVTYATLFARAGTAYGVGDGATTFNLPDLRGRVPVGIDGTAARLSANDAKGNASGGEAATMPSHSHGGNTGTISADHTHTIGYAGVAYAGGGIFKNLFSLGAESGFSGTNVQGVSANHTHPITAEGSGNNMQPFQIVQYIIRAL